MREEWFFTMKAHETEEVDLIIYGDSRTSEAVDTRPFQEAFPEHTPRNMGFPTGSFNPFMFDYLRDIIAGKEDRMIVLLGITPYSLTTETASNGHFLDAWDLPAEEVAKRLTLNPMMGFFDPVSPSLFFDVDQGKGRYVTYHPDGWEAAYELPLDPRRWLGRYEDAFRRTQVDPDSVEATYDFVREMDRRGIPVFAFRPPTTPAMEKIENEQSGFDEAAFARGFEAAGGEWIEHEDRFAYFSYDGSHLHYRAARAFSRDLAAAVAGYHSR